MGKPRVRTKARAGLTCCLVGLVIATAPLDVAAQNAPKALIVVRADSVLGTVSPLIFGASLRLDADTEGSADPATGLIYPHTIEQVKDVGVALIGYPAGGLSDVFQWQHAVGPQPRRGNQVGGLMPNPAPADSRFGPDEYGDLLDKSGAVGGLMINFTTASAADAANFVAYMSSPVGSALVNGVDWSSRRAANRHPTPYKIAYAVVGNVYQAAAQALGEQISWMAGEPTNVNAGCAADRVACLYAFGGATRFEHQAAVQVTNWADSASVSSGEPHQMLYARYAPVAAGSETVWVDGLAWQGLSELAAAAADAKVYRINYPTGAISFGDGVHGAIPRKGGRITLSYTSGPHEGFVDFYRAIKSVNPTVKVCAAINDESFIRIMGPQHAYDCIQQHSAPMGQSQPSIRSGSLDAIFVQLAAETMGLGAEIQHTQELVKKYAGANAAKVDVMVSECSPLGASQATVRLPARSAGAAVLHALCLRQWVLSGVAAAAGPALTAVQGAHAVVQLPNSEPMGSNALFLGPGPQTIITPLALAMKLVRQHTGNELLGGNAAGSPQLTSSTGTSISALQSYATRDARGNVYLVVINVDPQHDIDATVRVESGSFGPAATVATLGSRELLDDNALKGQNPVSINITNAVAGSGTIELSFPKHSVTGITLTAAK